MQLMGLFLYLLVLLITLSNLGCLNLVLVCMLFNLNHLLNLGFLNDFLAIFFTEEFLSRMQSYRQMFKICNLLLIWCGVQTFEPAQVCASDHQLMMGAIQVLRTLGYFLFGFHHLLLVSLSASTSRASYCIFSQQRMGLNGSRQWEAKF